MIYKTIVADEHGETLVEALVSVLIISAVFLMLCTAIVTAANINEKARGLNPYYNAAAVGDEKPVKVEGPDYGLTIDGSEVDFDLYKQNGYLYYSYPESDAKQAGEK